MAARPLLCLTRTSSGHALLEQLRGARWDIDVAATLDVAHRMLRQRRYPVGLIVSEGADDDTFAELDTFLKAHAAPVWVGAFDPAALARPRCRDLILDHLFDHHTVPIDAQRLTMTIGHAYGHAMLRQVPGDCASGPGAGSIIGESAAVKNLMQQLRRVAKVDAPVLVCGESGSGKELAARAIHELSARAGGPFVAVNCGAIQPTLIQSELFGHAKGAFTGAAREERGLIEAAGGGTIFLDEIGDLSLELQVNLLRFLQERTITRVGSTRSIPVDTRVVAATHVDLDKAVAAGSFREDLYYRLNVLPVTVPPLRARKSDIALLAQHFFEKFGNEKSPQLKGFSQRALVAMTDHSWPGNVRELINRVRRAMVMADGRLVTPVDLGLETLAQTHSWDALDDARGAAERTAIFVTLQHAGQNVTEAARRLGVSRMTLYRLMAKHDIAP